MERGARVQLGCVSSVCTPPGSLTGPAHLFALSAEGPRPAEEPRPPPDEAGTPPAGAAPPGAPTPRPSPDARGAMPVSRTLLRMRQSGFGERKAG